MSSSLISTIKQAILTDTASDVSIHERSLLSLLLEYNYNGESISWKNLAFHSYRGKSLVIAHHLIHFLNWIVLLFICLLYGIYNILHKIATGKWRGMRPSSGINIVFFSAVVVFAALALTFILTFLIREVVLSPNNAHINEKGVVTIDQPCLESQSFFLLNAATYWTSTGIPIMEGDVVYITASGSMYSDVGEMYLKAKGNDTLLYPRSFFNPSGKQEIDEEDVKYCIYGRNNNDSKARFGSLLYQICRASQGPATHNEENNNPIKQINFKEGKSLFQDKTFHFTAKTSGTLFMTFNDIYLDKEIYDSILKDTDSQTYKDLCEHPIDITDKGYPEDPTIWFQDNIGEVLVNVRIEKNICRSDMRWYKKLMVYFYRELGKVKTLYPWKAQFWETKFAFLISIIGLIFATDIVLSCILKRRNNKKNNN